MRHDRGIKNVSQHRGNWVHSKIGRVVVKNVDKIIKKIKVDDHVSTHSSHQEQEIDYKTMLNYLGKVLFKRKIDTCVTRQLT